MELDTEINTVHISDVSVFLQGNSEEVREEKQNDHNSRIDDSSQLQPFLEQNYVVGTSVSNPSETEKDKGLGDSLPNTANSSQTSLAMCAVPNDLQSCHTNQSSSSALAWQPYALVRVAAFICLNITVA